MEIQAQHTIENGLMIITEEFKIPMSFFDLEIDLQLAKTFGYSEQMPIIEDGAFKGMTESTQHPVDFILDYFHKQLEEGAKAIVTGMATEQAKQAAEAQFNQLMGG